MRTDGISTLNISGFLRQTVMSVQSRLIIAQTEVSTGRHSDIGLTLGAGVRVTIGLRGEMDELQQMIDGGKLAGTRAELAQSTMDSISQIASSFMNTLTGARTAANGQALARQAATAAMQSLRDLLNTSYNGQYIFGGVNSQNPPLPDDAGVAAVDNAFLASFGMAQSDAAVTGISSADMRAFLDGPFSNLFNPSGWSQDWTPASGQGLLTRAGPGHTVDTSVSARNGAFADLAQALTMAISLGEDKLGGAAFEAIADKSLSLLGKAAAGIGAEQSRAGLAQAELKTAVEHMTIKSAALVKSIQSLESVDPYEAATRVTDLMNQLQVSYTITGRLSGLSLANYI